MRGEGPPFIQIGRSVRYQKVPLRRWLKVAGEIIVTRNTVHLNTVNLSEYISIKVG